MGLIQHLADYLAICPSVCFCRNYLTPVSLNGKIIKITFRRRYLMDQKGFKKILAGLSITALVTGVTLGGVGYPEPAQAA